MIFCSVQIIGRVESKDGEIWDTKSRHLSRSMSRFVAWRVVSCNICVAQSRTAIYFSRQISWTRNKCLLRDNLITESEKREASTQNIQQNNVALQVESFFVSKTLFTSSWGNPSSMVTLARGLPWHSHISSYFQRRIYKAARVTLELG